MSKPVFSYYEYYQGNCTWWNITIDGAIPRKLSKMSILCFNCFPFEYENNQSQRIDSYGRLMTHF
jgi:hypothetical protein